MFATMLRSQWSRERAVAWMLVLGVLAVVLAGTPLAARACSVCACGDPLLDASDPAATMAKLRLQLEAEYLSITSGSHHQEGTTDALDQYTLHANAAWSPTDRAAVVLDVPLARKELRTAIGSDHRHAPEETLGLGDVEVGGRYELWRWVNLGRGRYQGFAVSAGTSLPTGESAARDDDGERLDEHAQLGTGAWGPYAGLHYRVDQGRWYAFASLSGRARDANRFGYRYGSALLWSVHGQLRPSPRLSLGLGLDGRTAGRDRDDEGVVEHTGGLVLAAAPSVAYGIGSGVWLSARAQLPFYTELAGVQSVRPTVYVAAQYELF
jgi:hypothetical protein